MFFMGLVRQPKSTSNAPKVEVYHDPDREFNVNEGVSIFCRPVEENRFASEGKQVVAELSEFLGGQERRTLKFRDLLIDIALRPDEKVPAYVETELRITQITSSENYCLSLRIRPGISDTVERSDVMPRVKGTQGQHYLAELEDYLLSKARACLVDQDEQGIFDLFLRLRNTSFGEGFVNLSSQVEVVHRFLGGLSEKTVEMGDLQLRVENFGEMEGVDLRLQWKQDNGLVFIFSPSGILTRSEGNIQINALRGEVDFRYCHTRRSSAEHVIALLAAYNDFKRGPVQSKPAADEHDDIDLAQELL
jgi:hypothetical protein